MRSSEDLAEDDVEEGVKAEEHGSEKVTHAQDSSVLSCMAYACTCLS
jgi:hypothetical protein